MATGWQGCKIRDRAFAAARFLRWPTCSFLFRLGAKPSRTTGLPGGGGRAGSWWLTAVK
jgi:hypothetical protein